MVKLFVGNLPPSASNETLREIFQHYYDLQDYKLISNYGFVYLESEQSAIHAVNTLNGLEYRGFLIIVNFAEDHGQLKRKASLMLEKSFPAISERFDHPVYQHRTMNSSSFSSSNIVPEPFDKYYNDYEYRNENPNRFFNDNSHQSYLQHNFQPAPKRFRSSFSTDNEFNNLFDFRENSYHFSNPLKIRSWTDVNEKTLGHRNYPHHRNHRFLLAPDNKRRPPPQQRLGQLKNKSYIDEYEDNEDYSSVDPYPAYLKQYQN